MVSGVTKNADQCARGTSLDNAVMSALSDHERRGRPTWRSKTES